MYAAVNLGRTSMDQAMVESQLPQCIVALGIGWGEADMLRNAASSLLVAILLRKEVSIPYRSKTYEHLDEDDQVEKTEEKEAIELIFHEEIKEQ